MSTSSTTPKAPVVKRVGNGEDIGKLFARPMDGTRAEGHRQLRRDLRAQRRPEVGAGPAARHNQWNLLMYAYPLR